MTTLQPIQTLAPERIDVVVTPTNGVISHGINWGALLLWFFIIGAIAYFILWLVKPSWLQATGPLGAPTGVADVWKTLLAAIVIAIIIIAIIYLIRGCR